MCSLVAAQQAAMAVLRACSNLHIRVECVAQWQLNKLQLRCCRLKSLYYGGMCRSVAAQQAAVAVLQVQISILWWNVFRSVAAQQAAMAMLQVQISTLG